MTKPHYHLLTSLGNSHTRIALILACLLLTVTVANRFYFTRDITGTNRHTLLPESVDTLALLKTSVDLEVFISPQDLQRHAISALLNKYQRIKENLNVTFTDPALDPKRTRDLNIEPGGEIFLRYSGRTQRIRQVSEQAVTTALQRLARSQTPTASFITGHGERAIAGGNNSDLGIFASQLEESGFKLNTLDLTDVVTLDSSDLVVIASPIQRYLPQESAKILDFLSRGGNLIWLTEPFSDDGLKALEYELGIDRLPGVVVDLAAQKLQVEQPDFAVANTYSRHPATNSFTAVTLFPQATGINLHPNREWRAAALVQAGKQAWTETSALTGQLVFGDDNREKAGPFPLAMSLERDKQSKTQKIVIVGDGDFVADAWIMNGGNRDLGNRLFNWAADDHELIGINRPELRDTQLNLSKHATLTLAAVALLLLPGLLLTGATRVWYQRRHG